MDILRKLGIDVCMHVCYYTRASAFRGALFRLIFYGGSTMRTRITLACTECKNRNYDTTKDKKTHPDRMETKKYCRFCKRHTMHKETK